MRDGYNEECKCTCLGLSLVMLLFSPNLVGYMNTWLPKSDTAIASVTLWQREMV